MFSARIPANLCLALLSTFAAAEAPLRTIEMPAVQPHASFSLQAARAWTRPAGVSFELEGGARVEGDRIRVLGWLANASSEPQLVVLFPVGASGLMVQPTRGQARPQPGPPRPPPAPLPPLALTLPARSRLRFETVFVPSTWEWAEGAPRELEWSFQFWNEPKPRGLLLIP